MYDNTKHSSRADSARSSDLYVEVKKGTAARRSQQQPS